MPLQNADLASVHVAMYDAIIAVVGGCRHFLLGPTAPPDGASADAAGAAAAYTVLKALYPSRQALFQSAYDQSLPAIADDAARSNGEAIGVEVGTAVLPFVTGTEPGQFRGPALAGRTLAFVKPFAVQT